MRDRSNRFARATVEHSIVSVNRASTIARRTGVVLRDDRRRLVDDESDEAAADARAGELVADLLGVAGKLPGATGISFHPFGASTFVYITVATDAAVESLADRLGLGAPERRELDGQWWYRAMSRRERSNHYITVIGPFHEGAPPVRDLCTPQGPRGR